MSGVRQEILPSPIGSNWHAVSDLYITVTCFSDWCACPPGVHLHNSVVHHPAMILIGTHSSDSSDSDSSDGSGKLIMNET